MTRKVFTAMAAVVAVAALVPSPAHAALPPPTTNATATATATATKQQAKARAMWLWSQANPAAVVAWANKQGVKEIFAAVPWQPVRLAAETQPASDCTYCTFAGRTQAALQQQLAAIDAGARGYGTYQGIAAHDYDTWSNIN
nr:hypothetical protein GCM10020063_057870 [Dactylosporangium thailandense]